MILGLFHNTRSANFILEMNERTVMSYKIDKINFNKNLLGFRGVESNEMLTTHIGGSFRFSFFPYFIEQP